MYWVLLLLLDVTGTATSPTGGGGGGGTPGGSTTQIQFNDAGVFGGDTGFTWDKTGNLMNIPGATGSSIVLGTSGLGTALNLTNQSNHTKVSLSGNSSGHLGIALDTPMYFSNSVNFAGAVGQFGNFSALTPDSLLLAPPALSNSIHIAEFGDAAFDFQNGPCGTSACFVPTFILHSNTAATNKWLSLYHDDTNAYVESGSGTVTLRAASTNAQWSGTVFSLGGGGSTVSFTGSGGGLAWISTGGNISSQTNEPVKVSANTYSHQVWHIAKSLTESSAVAVMRVPVNSGGHAGGDYSYTIYANDGTNFQTRRGSVRFAVVNIAGTETCTLSAASEAADGSVVTASSGTLTYAITCSTTPTNGVDLTFNVVSSLAQTALVIDGDLRTSGTANVAPTMQ